MTILKPLHGTDTLTELALESFFLLTYPVYQLVFGVQNNRDPVLTVIANLRVRYPDHDVAVMVNDIEHGRNRKVSNLINMRPLAKYDFIVISDADMHVPPYYLDAVVAGLEDPRIGLVSCVYTGLPVMPGLVGQLGAAQINYSFLPGVLLARRLGRQDCMGVTMALRSSTLDQIGGLPALADYLADDQVLGRMVLAAGYEIKLAQVIPATSVPETSVKSLLRHELRWARTIRALVPIAYTGTGFQMPIMWGILTMLFSAFGVLSISLFLAVFAVRVATAWWIEGILRLPRTRNVWIFVLRDFLSAIVYITSFMGSSVEWSGQSMIADPGRIELRSKK